MTNRSVSRVLFVGTCLILLPLIGCSKPAEEEKPATSTTDAKTDNKKTTGTSATERTVPPAPPP